MIDLRKLRMLAELQRHGTIAAAARELHLTASGVSMQLAALEREAGVPLTERQGRGVVLTPAGVLLAEHGHELLARLSLAQLEVDAIRRGTVGRYTIAAFPSAARTIVADTWQGLLSEGSALDLRVATHEPEAALSALVSGDADLAVIHSYSNVPREIPANVRARAIATEPVWLAIPGSDRNADKSVLDLGDYAEHAWITPDRELTCYTMAERACGLAGFQPRIVATTLDFSVQLALVAAGVGVALIPDLTVASVPDGVVLRPLSAPVSRSLAVAIRSSGVGDPGLRQLSERLGASAARLCEDRGVRPADGGYLPKNAGFAAGGR